MSEDDLFSPAEAAPVTFGQPLAERLRPRAIADIVGQEHLLGPQGSLTGMLARGSLASLILWGPPGVGKTTIARLLARRCESALYPDIGGIFRGRGPETRVRRCPEAKTRRTLNIAVRR